MPTVSMALVSAHSPDSDRSSGQCLQPQTVPGVPTTPGQCPARAGHSEATPLELELCRDGLGEFPGDKKRDISACGATSGSTGCLTWGCSSRSPMGTAKVVSSLFVLLGFQGQHREFNLHSAGSSRGEETKPSSWRSSEIHGIMESLKVPKSNHTTMVTTDPSATPTWFGHSQGWNSSSALHGLSQ
ncbi:hypothetical protein HGM15179_016242 [Zosterops borbonicus]|uniref:Uncharacterized protein n=1 Tax=Zosterops borbonicus TaxID=364589 RepID=A0A8K1LEJ3_9PASS|nr:hypothetical protein HGM15179_022554 [Zosterops borbonicus]TRZ10863.1 hypothetical protein HGM15179_016242 [Zosterops borbonicus]